MTSLALLLLLLLICRPVLCSDPRRLILHVRCFNHTSHQDVDGVPCSNDFGACDPRFEFCLTRRPADHAECVGGRRSFKFNSIDRLGACASDVRPNFPDRVLLANLSVTPAGRLGSVYLQVKISHHWKSKLASTVYLIDRLAFNLSGRALPDTPFGEGIEPGAAVLSPMTSAASAVAWAPQLQLQAGLECPAYRFGPGCGRKCEASPRRVCHVNGSWECVGDGEGYDCATLSPTRRSTTVAMTTTASVERIARERLLEIIIIVGGLMVFLAVLIATAVFLHYRCRKAKRSSGGANLTVRYTAPPAAQEPVQPISELARLARAGPCHPDKGQPLRVDLSSPYDDEDDLSLPESVYDELDEVYSTNAASNGPAPAWRSGQQVLGATAAPSPVRSPPAAVRFLRH